jgi:sugar-specific transcriptional regulator TrmB
MLNKEDSPQELLHSLGLKHDEAKLYVELLKGPNTHLRLAHATGINRTKVYRLADQLEKQGLIIVRADDRGTFLEASDPATLEADLVMREEKVREQRAAFETVLPVLAGLKTGDASKFVVHTYDGEDGFKQMLWHELKTKGENLIFGSGTIEDLVPNRAWAEKHRALTVQADYAVREILNPDSKGPVFTLNQEFIAKHYSFRVIDPAIITFEQQMVIYNDTVAVYNLRDEQRVGVEVINAAYANTMRQIFEHYWQLAQ